MPKLTKRKIDSAEAQEKEYFIWDDTLPGFGLRVLPSGRKSYIVQYRAGRRARRMSLGPSTILACEQARGQAITILAAVRKGEDPSPDRAAQRCALNMTELAERFDAEHISVRLKESTATEYRRNLWRFILPALGRLAMAEASRANISKFHHDLRHIPYQANRCLEVLSKMFNLAEMWGLRPDGSNPRKHIRKYPEGKTGTFPEHGGIAAYWRSAAGNGNEGIELPSAILAARLLILTGCRLGEIMTLRWEFLDLPEKLLRLPDSKTGAKLVHLGQPAVELLASARPIKDNPWVIAGTLKGKHLSDLQPFWQRVRARAGLKDARVHDLRHTFASTAVASGQGFPMIGKLLGHAQVQTTARYAHLAAEPVRNAADSVAASLRDALG